MKICLSVHAFRAFCILSFFCLFAGSAAAQEIIPFPRSVIKTEKVLEWRFPTDTAGWDAAHDCSMTSVAGILRIQGTGNDPYLFGPAIQIVGPITVRLRLRCGIGGNGQVFWTTPASPDFTEEQSEHFHLFRDNQWHDYDVLLPEEGTVQRLRLDPAETEGTIDVESIQLLRQTMHPLEIQAIHTDGANVRARLKNYGSAPIAFSLGGRNFHLAGGATEDFFENAAGNAPFRAHEVIVESTGLPALHQIVAIVDTNLDASWATLQSDKLVVRAARDGSGARLERDGHLVAVLAPLLSKDGVIPELKLDHEGQTLLWHGQGISLELSLRDDEVLARIKSDGPCEGPVLRAFGPLEQGLFPGLEDLAAGEHSSSTLDIETEEHIRFAPDPMKVTMPLMAFVTGTASTAMTWRDMSLHPIFATPNFLDGPDGHRASLRGTNMECTVLVRPPAPLEETILWAVQKHGMPPLPTPPRSRQEERNLCLATLSGPPLRTAQGWGHCAEASWTRQPYADQASTLWRLTGQAPDLPRLAPGGAHIVNDSIYFLTGRAEEWLKMKAAGAAAIIAEQKPDGSFRYDGKYRRGHFEDTASGYCAARAVQLLEHARLTGNTPSLQAGVKALEFMKHFRDPRGAQTWECPLHTPDILASAWLVQAYARGYELTGQADYLARARQWAITGLPFVYQWSSEPTMAYATIAVFGATGWRAPNWMGLPVQWCGYDYAYALTMLAPLDHTLDWKTIATGILITAEQMQFPSGEFAGCEPDSFNLAQQHRNGPAINPCALVSLRLALDGKVDSLAVASQSGHRVIAPFPISIRDGVARIEGRPGLSYQVVIDGDRIVSVLSQGHDSVALPR